MSRCPGCSGLLGRSAAPCAACGAPAGQPCRVVDRRGRLHEVRAFHPLRRSPTATTLCPACVAAGAVALTLDDGQPAVLDPLEAELVPRRPAVAR